MFDFIMENLYEIQNPETVNCIITSHNDYGRFLVACKTDGRKIKLTEELDWFTHPFMPMVWLTNVVGKAYMQNFGIIGASDTCVNKNNVNEFSISPDNKDRSFVKITATFKSGHTEPLYPVLKRFGFEKRELKAVQKFFNVQGRQL